MMLSSNQSYGDYLRLLHLTRFIFVLKNFIRYFLKVTPKFIECVMVSENFIFTVKIGITFVLEDFFKKQARKLKWKIWVWVKRVIMLLCHEI